MVEGFGYAFPQGRLRRRLSVIHGANVTLVDEYYTSRYCCKCHQALLAPKATHSLEKILSSRVLRKKWERNRFQVSNNRFRETLHGVWQCSYCRNVSGKVSPQGLEFSGKHNEKQTMFSFWCEKKLYDLFQSVCNEV